LQRTTSRLSPRCKLLPVTRLGGASDITGSDRLVQRIAIFSFDPLSGRSMA